MKALIRSSAISSIAGLAVISCGWSTYASASSSPLDALFGDAYKVEALVINEGSEPVEVALMNAGPHGGGCDS